MGIMVGAWISPVALGAVALAVVLGLRAPWWGVLLVLAACGALAVAAVLALARWTERRAVRVWAQRPGRLPAREVPAALPPAGAPAIGQQHVHFHYHAADGQQAPAITEGKSNVMVQRKGTHRPGHGPEQAGQVHAP